MREAISSNTNQVIKLKFGSNLKKTWNNYKLLYLMLIPGLIYFVIFHYLPMFGVVIAFKDYNFVSGIFGSKWSNPDIFKWFKLAFFGGEFGRVLKNTLIISVLKFIFNFPAPIILALLLNEVKNIYFKRTVQTMVYLPHFISWVVIGGIMFSILSSSTGILSVFGVKSSILMDSGKFRGVLVVSEMWKEAGWGTVVYLAAIAGINMEMYGAAIIDGANRFQRMIYITIPSIMGTVAVLAILRTGHILSAGFDQIFVLSNSVTMDVADVLDTYVYRVGLAAGRFSLATAIGLFKSVVGLVMVLSTNWLVKRIGEKGLW